MKIISCLLVLFLSSSLIARCGGQPTEELVWDASKALPTLDSRMTFQNGSCRIRRKSDGNIVVKRLIDGRYVRNWQTGPMLVENEQEDTEFSMALKTDEKTFNIESFLRKKFSSDSEFETVRLIIDGDCRLKLYKKNRVVWQNIADIGHVTSSAVPFRRRLARGNMLVGYDEGVPYTVDLLRNCQLVQYVGRDRADLASSEDPKLVWTANPEVRRENIDFCVLRFESDSIVLCGKDRVELWKQNVTFDTPYKVRVSAQGGLVPYPFE